MGKDINEMIKVAEKLGWAVDVYDNEFTFRKYSPAGQDFSMTVIANSLEVVVEKIQERCEDFDCSEEAYLWMDNTGHGTNGAPYDMKDLYEDMESCLEMMNELRNELEKF